MSAEGVIAANRFGLGARPGEVARASANPRQWLLDQIGPADQPQPVNGQPFQNGAALVAQLAAYRRQRREMKQSGDVIKGFFQNQRKGFIDEMAARFDLGFTSARPYSERLVWFWGNHFTISTANAGTAGLAGAYEREAIRPHIAGKFEDMLVAVATHPAMLVYLNNAQSIGPDSMAGQRSKRGLNENFGRELMELYSLGVDGGYTQADVIALAKLLTGWSVAADNAPALGGGRGRGRFLQVNASGEDIAGASSGFQFFPARHEPGTITVRGKSYPQGYEGGRAAIHDLARDPSTARFVARKFAVHFVGDDPPPASVARLEKTFRDTGGDLGALARAVVEDPAAWQPGAGKMRNPVEYVTASYRLLGLPRAENAQRQTAGAMQSCRMMGQFPMTAPSPKGWPDQSSDWSGPDAVLSRIAWARQLGTRLPQNVTVADVTLLADGAEGPLLGQVTRSAMMKSANAGEALALFLSSPEFQRR